MDEPTLAEKEAILLRYRRLYPDAPPGSIPSPEQSSELLAEIREHVAGVEQESISMLYRSLRERPTGGGSRHVRFFVMIVLGALLLLAVVAAVVSLWQAGRGG